MTRSLDPPRQVGGVTLRVVVDTRVGAHAIGRGIAAHGEKRPCTVVLGTGPAARVFRLDGAECTAADLGLAPDDLL